MSIREYSWNRSRSLFSSRVGQRCRLLLDSLLASPAPGEATVSLAMTHAFAALGRFLPYASDLFGRCLESCLVILTSVEGCDMGVPSPTSTPESRKVPFRDNPTNISIMNKTYINIIHL